MSDSVASLCDDFEICDFDDASGSSGSSPQSDDPIELLHQVKFNLCPELAARTNTQKQLICDMIQESSASSSPIKAQSSSEVTNALRSTMESEKKKNEELTKQIAILTKELTKQVEEKQASERKRIQLEKFVVELRGNSNRDQLLNRIQDLECQLTAAKAAPKITENELSSTEQLEKHVAFLKRENADIKSTADAIRSEFDNQGRRYQKVISDLSQKCNNLNGIITKLQSRLAEKEEELAAVSCRLDKNKDSSEELRRQNLSLQHKLDMHTDKSPSYDQLKAQMTLMSTNFKKEEAKYQNFIKTLQAQLEQVTIQFRNVSQGQQTTSNAELVKKTAECDALRSTADECTAKYLESELTIKTLRDTVDVQKKEISQLKSHLREATDAEDLFKMQFDEYKKNFEDERKRANDLKTKLDEKEYELKKLSIGEREATERRLQTGATNSVNGPSSSRSRDSTSGASSSGAGSFNGQPAGSHDIPDDKSQNGAAGLSRSSSRGSLMASLNPFSWKNAKNEGPKEEEEQFICPVCTRELPDLESLQIHLNTECAID